MRLAIDCRQFGASGIGTYIENIVAYLVNNVENQYVLIGNSQKLSVYQEKSHCTIVPCHYKPFTPQELLFFPVHEVNQCDAYYTPNFNLPTGIKVPIFSTIHDVVFFDVKGICSPMGKLIRRIYIKRALRISKSVFTVSYFSKSRIEKLFNPHCPIVVTYSGISQELIDYKKSRDTNMTKENQIVFLGNLKKQKGIQVLIKAYKLAKETGMTDAKLLMIGHINFRTKDPDILPLLNQEENDDIQYLHNASNKQVYDTVSQSRALISPSFYEGFGLPPLEAMYLGTPAIISDIPVYQEIYKDTNVTYFSSGNTEDLANKIRYLPDTKVDVESIVTEKYNFQTISNIITNTIHKSKSVT